MQGYKLAIPPIKNAEAPRRPGKIGSESKKKEEHKLNYETRGETLRKIDFYLPTLTDEQLRMVSAFIRGIKKWEGRS